MVLGVEEEEDVVEEDLRFEGVVVVDVDIMSIIVGMWICVGSR